MIDRRSINELKPTVWVGKNGCTEVVIEEIRRQVKAREIVKVRWLRGAEIDPAHLARCTGTDILDLRGRTIVLSKKGIGTAGSQSRNI